MPSISLRHFAAMALVTGAALPSFAQGSTASNLGSAYPIAPPDTSGHLVQRPSISFTPRPVDPPGSQAVDIFKPQRGVQNINPLITTTGDVTQPTPLEDILGPDGSDLSGHPGFSGYGVIFNNLTGQNITVFKLDFLTDASITDIAVDTYVRTPDLQHLFLNSSESPVGTFNHQESYVNQGNRNLWTILFTEANGYAWADTSGGPIPSDPTVKIPSFTLLTSLFPVGSGVNFVYTPQPGAVPEPGAIAFLTGLGSVGFAIRRRRRRSSRV